jgi:DNA-binding NarL/FixJ family response regulator
VGKVDWENNLRRRKFIKRALDFDLLIMRYQRRAKNLSPKNIHRSLTEHNESEVSRPGSKGLLKSESKAPIRVFLADNCLTFRDGLELAITQSKTLQIVGRACSAEEIFKNGTVIPADVAVVDIDLPGQSGFEVCQQLLQLAPTMSVVLISYNDWDIYLLAAQTIHSKGLLLRSQPTLELIAALEKAVSRPIFTAEQIGRIQTWRNTTGTKLKNLGKREWQVLQLVALGRSNREIAKLLDVSKNTVEKHVSNILEKLELDSRAMVMIFIYTNHLDELSRLPHGDRFLMLLAN